MSELSLTNQTSRIMKLDLATLPQFNVTYISRCLTVSERLNIIAKVHRRFRNFIYQPQCFPDMSFFPVQDDERYQPKILSSNANHGITYVEINIFSQHPFVQRVALLAGMWNFKADLWNQVDWPSNINIESLQLTLDYTSSASSVHLDHHPSLTNNNNISENRGENERQLEGQLEGQLAIDGPLSPTTRKPMELKCRLRNLFFIRFDSSGHQPTIYFPKTLWGLGLQSFTSSIFSQGWWIQQIRFEQRLESLRFLVLSCCNFTNDELQILLQNTNNVEHLSLRYVQWDGVISFPKSLLSLGYFPDRHFKGYYSFKLCTKLWQISTRLNENEEASIEFLNCCSKIQSIQRVKFEFIRKEQYSERNVALGALEKWKERDNDELTVAISDEDLDHYPILKEIISIPSSNFLSLESVKFEDCPLWSDESFDFIHMTNKRKLLLR
eukprot:362010_1